MCVMWLNSIFPWAGLAGCMLPTCNCQRWGQQIKFWSWDDVEMENKASMRNLAAMSSISSSQCQPEPNCENSALNACLWDKGKKQRNAGTTSFTACLSAFTLGIGENQNHVRIWSFVMTCSCFWTSVFESCFSCKQAICKVTKFRNAPTACFTAFFCFHLRNWWKPKKLCMCNIIHDNLLLLSHISVWVTFHLQKDHLQTHMISFWAVCFSFVTMSMIAEHCKAWSLVRSWHSFPWQINRVVKNWDAQAQPLELDREVCKRLVCMWTHSGIHC